MKKILIVAHYLQTPSEKGNSRFTYLADMLTKVGFDVELVTSSFSHKFKRQRRSEEVKGYKLTFIYEKGYKKNVSIKRVLSHNGFSRKVKKYIADINADLVYLSCPSDSLSKVVATTCKKKNIPYILDVQDLWPEAFKMVVKNKLLYSLLFFGMKRRMNFVYKNASYIFTVSKEYADKVKSITKKDNVDYVYLGTDLTVFLENAEKNKFVRMDDSVYLVFAGSLGNSYAIKEVIDAVRIFRRKGYNINFKVLGEGVKKEEFISYANGDTFVDFTGNLPYDKMCGYLSSCDIAISPINSLSASSILNKVGDYFSASLPLINTQNCLEQRKMLEENNAGINTENDSEKIADTIEIYLLDKIRMKENGSNAYLLAKKYFDRKITYVKIIDKIKEMTL